MKNISGLLVLLSFFLSSCGGSAGEAPPGALQEDAAAPPPDEDEWILRLSGELTADPQTQAEKDRNAIVNYAIDERLDVKPTASGLFYQVLREGEGEPLRWGDRVRVNYRGFFPESGVEFDASRRRGEPMEFYIGNVIDGWNEGLQLLRPGARALFLVPSHLAYGAEGMKDSKGKVLVPPNAVLGFEVEVLP